MRFRFSLAGLLVAVTVAAVASASLAFAGAAWTSAVASTAVTLLATALLIAALRPGAAQGFWLGMALWGWLYLALVFGPWADRLGPKLVTSVVLAQVAARMPRAEQADDNAWSQPQMTYAGPGGNVNQYFVSGFVRSSASGSGGYNEAFVTIGQFWCAPLLGCLGGWLARAIGAWDRQQPKPPPEAA